jgi:hypothetical protein
LAAVAAALPCIGIQHVAVADTGKNPKSILMDNNNRKKMILILKQIARSQT